MSLPDAQQNPYLRRYALRRHRLSTAAGTLSIVCPSRDGGRVLTGAMQRAADRGGEPPYWAQVWPASVALARALLREDRHSAAFRGAKVVDLGCGVGVAGAAAAMAGARVTAVDRDADALHFAVFNARQNARSAPPDGAPEVESQCLDWAVDRIPADADFLLLADVSYREVHHVPLLRQLRHGLAKGATAWHTDPHRTASSGFLARVAREFDVTEVELSAHLDGERHPVRLAVIRRRAAPEGVPGRDG